MQSVGLKNEISENIEEKLNCCNEKCQFMNEEFIALRRKITSLDQGGALNGSDQYTVSLENIIKMKDSQLENIHRDNERLSAELKKQQRCNRNIKQQLEDERFFYQREKDYFNDEIQRYQKSRHNNNPKFPQRERRELEEEKESLEKENENLRRELIEKSETTYNLCIKFLRMKHAKDALREKLDQLVQEHLQVMADMMEKLDEAREELNIIISEKFREPIPLNKAKFLQIVQRNTRLIHENASCKLQIQHLNLNLEKLKNCSQKPKIMNLDAKIITKLIEQSRKKRSKESTRWQQFASDINDTEKSESLTKKAVLNLHPVDHSGDAKLYSKIRGTNLENRLNTSTTEIQTEESKGFHPEKAYSAPEVVRTLFKRNYSSSVTVDQTDCSVDICDASTNT